jgi:hypothetical protein
MLYDGKDQQVMKMAKNWLGRAVVLTITLGCMLGCNYGTGIISTAPAGESSRNRADVIKIDAMAALGRLEKSPVEFLHDAHTKALAVKKLDCTACHLTQNNRIYPKFKRFEDKDRAAVMNIYHDGCIACHGEMNLANEKTGPIECNGCHAGTAIYTSSRQAMGFDQSLHFTHSQKADNKCEKCHHAYNETKKELFYDKGKEGTCRYCHEKKTEGNRVSMRQASHLGCINCHLNATGTQQLKPPVTCAGCHDPAEQQKFKKHTAIPRMDRNQPDVVLIKAASKSNGIDKKQSQMHFVPFNHKAHEAFNDSCRVCHHASLQQACNECHTRTGAPKGSMDTNAVNLEIAFHKTDSTRSCLGCHNSAKQDKNCAGCHAPMGRTREKKDEACIQCHSVPARNLPNPSTPEDETALARWALQSRKQGPASPGVVMDDIPETVTIQGLSKQYEAVKLPHRQIVTALADGIKDSRLAGFFHNGTQALCQGCHHHSPPSKKPPQCTNCHPKQWDENKPSMPGILGAYHLQCMGCHKQMKIEKTAECIDCHALKPQG